MEHSLRLIAYRRTPYLRVLKKSIEDNITGAKESVEQAFKLADEELKSTITTSYTDAISKAESSLKNAYKSNC